MSKILVIFGATGQQGGSLVNYVLNDPELSQQYKIRAVTRDLNSEKAKQLKDKVEVVQGDIADRASLETALTGAHTVFLMSTPSFTPDGLEVEYNNCKQAADVAVEKGVNYLIFSTLPSVEKISKGKYAKLTPFEAKAQAEDYIRSLPIKSAFYCPAFFMENFSIPFFFAPKKSSGGGDTWVVSRGCAPHTKYPVIDATSDTGKFVGAILADPDKYESKTFFAAVGSYTMEEITAVIAKTTGKQITYKEISMEEFIKASLKGMDPTLAEMFAELYKYEEEFNYFGPDEDELVAWAVGNARGKLTTLEEYLTRNPMQLV